MWPTRYSSRYRAHDYSPCMIPLLHRPVRYCRVKVKSQNSFVLAASLDVTVSAVFRLESVLPAQLCKGLRGALIFSFLFFISFHLDIGIPATLIRKISYNLLYCCSIPKMGLEYGISIEDDKRLSIISTSC
jgi:hypothetical protein